MFEKDRLQTNVEVKKRTYSRKHLVTLTMDELMEEDYPIRQPLIENLLYEGTYLYVGPPKVGKSFGVAQMAYHVAEGIPLWDFKVVKSGVLYLALEDDYGRLQQRLSRMFGVDGSENLHLATRSEKLGEGLIEQINEFLDRYPETKFVIIDTLQKIREENGDAYNYKNDYEVVEALKSISDERRICILIVHHSRKMGADDKFDMISGTAGLLGAADGAFMLMKKKRTDKTAQLEVVGRDQPSMALTLVFDHDACIWSLKEGEADDWEKVTDSKLLMIAEFMHDIGKEWEGTTQELMDAMDYHDELPSPFSRYLNVHKTELFNEYGVLYEREERKNKSRKLRLKKVEA